MERQRGLIRLSWIVFLHAALVSLESVAIEWLTVGAGIPSLPLTAISVTIAGGAFIVVVAVWRKAGGLFFQIFRKSWKPLLAGSALVAIALITWYDSVSRIGASKESLLAGPLETIVIVLLARMILGERLVRIQSMGVAVALIGFFATVGSGAEHDVSAGFLFSIGDSEAVLSALAFGAGIIIVTKLTAGHPAIVVTPAILLLSGLILLGSMSFVNYGKIEPIHLAWIGVFSSIPLAAGLTYVMGLSRIGASLTSTIASFSIVVVFVVQVASRAAGANVILPGNLPLAAAGGALSVLGIYLVHRAQVPDSERLTRQPV